MNARFYSPSSGRFITADTIIPNPTNPQSFNRYSYTYNNPLRFADPTGHRPDDGCEFEGCELPTGMDMDYTWQLPDGALIPWDPILSAKYPGASIPEIVGFTAVGLTAVAAAPAVIEYALAEVAWPTIARIGSSIASLFCLDDGDCTNEIRTPIEWLSDNALKIEHILAPKHYWDRLVNLSSISTLEEQYLAIQPYIQQTVDNGIRTILPTTPQAGNALAVEYTYIIQGETIIVRGIELANGIFKIGDAWIK